MQKQKRKVIGCYMKKKPNPKPTIDDLCFICNAPYAHTHEVFFGNPDARLSQDYGMTVRLCQYHHQDQRQGVHHNRGFDLNLKWKYYEKFKKMYPNKVFEDIFKTGWMKDERT